MAYIKQSLKGNDDEFRQVKEYLENNPFINSLCYIPLNMTILICLFKNFLESGNDILPKNQTEINEQFICMIISRFLKRKGASLTISLLKMLPKPYIQQIENLSKVAFDLLGKDRIVFNKNDIKGYASWSDLGLLKTVQFNSQADASYNFLHFSLQEFLAAYYVTSLYSWDQVSMLRDHFWDSRYLNMWVMYAGLTRGASFAFRHFLTGRTFIIHSLFFNPSYIANEIVGDKVKCLHLFQCFLEAGDDKICQQVGKCLMNDNIDISNTTLLPKDMHTLCFFLTRSTVARWKLLDLSNCYIGDDGCTTLVNLLLSDGKSKVQITKINLSNSRLTSNCIRTILKLVQYFDTKELTVIGNKFDGEILLDNFFTAVLEEQLLYEIILLVKTSTKQLSLFAVNINDLLNSQIQNYLYINDTVYKLCLWSTNFKLNDLLTLLSNVVMHSTIVLNIYKEDSNNNIVKIQSEIHKEVTEAKMKDKNIFSAVSYILVSQFQMLAYNMKDCQVVQVMKCKLRPSILTLHFTSCVLSTNSFYIIGNILSTDYKKLEIVRISGCNIEDTHFEAFYKAIFSSKSVIRHLKELNLSNNHLTSLSTHYIIHLLQLCTINKLILCNNEIDIDNFHTMYFKNRYDIYCNFGSKVPLIVVNNITNNEAAKYQHAQTLHFMVYFLSISFSADLVNTVAFDDNCVWIFLINTNVTMDCFNNAIKLLLANNMIKITIVEEDLKDDIVDNMITQLKAFQALKYHKNGERPINYCLLNSNNLGMNNYVKTTILNLNILESFKNHYFLSLFPPINSFGHKHWDMIDLSHCNLEDNGCTMLLNYFVSSVCTITINVLNLSNNNFSLNSTDNIAKLIVYFKLKTLFISNNKVKENHVAYAVHKLQSKSSEASVPLICIFKNQFVALVIHNLIISSIHKLIDWESCHVTYLSLTNCVVNDEEDTHTVFKNELDLSQKILQQLECSIEALDEERKITHFIVENCSITHKATMLLASEFLIHSELTHLRYCIANCQKLDCLIFSLL